MGSMDVPASIKYILNYTGEKTLSFMCLSFRCTLFFICMSTHPDLNDSVDILLAIAPSAGLRDIKSPVPETIYRHRHAIEVIFCCN